MPGVEIPQEKAAQLKLQDLLPYHKWEKLEGFNCTACQGMNNEVAERVVELPKLFMLQLCRFKSHLTIKKTDLVQFPVGNMSITTSTGDYDCRMEAVIYHSGHGTDSGHYFTTTRDPNDSTQWIEWNDSHKYKYKVSVADVVTPEAYIHARHEAHWKSEATIVEDRETNKATAKHSPQRPPKKPSAGGTRGLDLGRKGPLPRPKITVTVPGVEFEGSATSASKALDGAAATGATPRTPQVDHFAQPTASSLRRTYSTHSSRDVNSTPTAPNTTAATVGRRTRLFRRPAITPDEAMTQEAKASEAAKRSASRLSKKEPKKPRRSDDGDGDADFAGLTRRISGLSTTTTQQPTRVSNNIAFVERLMQANRNASPQEQEQFEDLLDLLRHYPRHEDPQR